MWSLPADEVSWMTSTVVVVTCDSAHTYLFLLGTKVTKIGEKTRKHFF